MRQTRFWKASTNGSADNVCLQRLVTSRCAWSKRGVWEGCVQSIEVWYHMRTVAALDDEYRVQNAYSIHADEINRALFARDLVTKQDLSLVFLAVPTNTSTRPQVAF